MPAPNQEHEVHPILELMKRWVEPLQVVFGRGAEVVLRDLTMPSMPIVAIAGTVTGRRCGDPPTDLFRHWLENRDTNSPHLNYRGRTSDGLPLRSSTLFIHGGGGELLGCLCINIDISHLAPAAQWLSQYCEATGVILFGKQSLAGQSVDCDGTADLATVVRTTIDAAVQGASNATGSMSREQRLEVVRSLDRLGVFLIKNSTELVASRLGISKTALYKYLQAIRKGSEAT